MVSTFFSHSTVNWSNTTKAPRTATGTEFRQKLEWNTLAQRRKLRALKMAHTCIHRVGPSYLHHKFQYISDLPKDDPLVCL